MKTQGVGESALMLISGNDGYHINNVKIYFYLYKPPGFCDIML